MIAESRYQYEQGRGRRKSRTEAAVDSIEEMIRDNGWAAGQRLPSQRTLAVELGLSRPTVREALVALEARGRLAILPGKGVFLNDESPAMNQTMGAPVRVQAVSAALSGRESQMYQFRYAIEPAIAGLVAVNVTAAQLADMGVVVAGMRRALEARDLAEFSRLDFAFHSHMIEAANNRFFTEAITPFLGLFFESQTLPLAMDDSVHDTVREHEEIMEHIRAGRAAEAHRAMEKHVRGVAERAGVKLVE